MGNQSGIIGKVKSERTEINFVVPFSLQSFLWLLKFPFQRLKTEPCVGGIKTNLQR